MLGSVILCLFRGRCRLAGRPDGPIGELSNLRLIQRFPGDCLVQGSAQTSCFADPGGQRSSVIRCNRRIGLGSGLQLTVLFKSDRDVVGNRLGLRRVRRQLTDQLAGANECISNRTQIGLASFAKCALGDCDRQIGGPDTAVVLRLLLAEIAEHGDGFQRSTGSEVGRPKQVKILSACLGNDVNRQGPQHAACGGDHVFKSPVTGRL